jgi:lysophospholipase L1-like esterase
MSTAAPTKVAPITLQELEAALFDPERSETDLAPYVVVVEGDEPFSVRLEPNPATVVIPEGGPGERGGLIVNQLNWWARNRRNRRFRERVQRGYDGPILLDEGDSWFQYPLLLKDTIDVVDDRYAVYSLSAAGDTLKRMRERAEYREKAVEVGAAIMLLSGGGNDVVGGGDLARHLRPFDPGRSPVDYLLPSFDDGVHEALAHYAVILDGALAAAPGLQILCHGYDHPVPDGGKWIGKPMASRGITDRSLQADIARLMLDRFNEGLADLVADYPRVHYLDLRGVVGADRWYDELHPTDAGYADVAARFADKVAELTSDQGRRRAAPTTTGTTLQGSAPSSGLAAEPSQAPSARSLHIGVNDVDQEHYLKLPPLSFCRADAEAMQELAADRGYRTQVLVDQAATRDGVKGAVAEAAAELTSGDIFLFTYSGHGSQVLDADGDEQHGPDQDYADETLCLFDGQLLDDELYELWSLFADGVRVVAVFDCCHSGSVIRAEGDLDADDQAGTPRLIPRAAAAKIWEKNKDFYRDVAAAVKGPGDGSISAAGVAAAADAIGASVIQLSACQSNQVARESFGHGWFTRELLHTLDELPDRDGYQAFLDRIAARLPARQTPRYWMIGRADSRFADQSPFTVAAPTSR